jgi:hypothetical protein
MSKQELSSFTGFSFIYKLLIYLWIEHIWQLQQSKRRNDVPVQATIIVPRDLMALRKDNSFHVKSTNIPSDVHKNEEYIFGDLFRS